MDVHIGEMSSSVRAVDESTWLTPATLERIVRLVVERVREDHARQERAKEDRALNASRLVSE